MVFWPQFHSTVLLFVKQSCLVYSFSCDRSTRASNFHSHPNCHPLYTAVLFPSSHVTKCTDIHGTWSTMFSKQVVRSHCGKRLVDLKLTIAIFVLLSCTVSFCSLWDEICKSLQLSLFLFNIAFVPNLHLFSSLLYLLLSVYKFCNHDPFIIQKLFIHLIQNSDMYTYTHSKI